MDEITLSATQIMMSYGAMGVCTVYFMAKDWIKAKETDVIIDRFTSAVEKFTAAALMCNRNGSSK